MNGPEEERSGDAGPEAGGMAPASEKAVLPPGRPLARVAIDTRAGFVAQLQLALERAERELWMVDRDFADWPIGTPSFASTLQTFLRRSAAHHLYMLTLEPECIAVTSPRFLAVMRAHAHHAQCRIVPAHAASRFGEACSMLIVDRSIIVRRFHRDHLRGSADFDPASARPWLDQFQTLWDESTSALASTTLGLG